MKRLSTFGLIIGLLLLMFSVLLSSMAHAQRYDSSYGYEQRGFIPPDPVPRALRDRAEDPGSNSAGSPPWSYERRVPPRQERRNPRN